MRLDKHFLFYKFPPIVYALLILSVSTLSFAAPPSFGISWEDKIYHGIEYLILGILVFRAFPGISSAGSRKLYLFLIIGGILFAILDETVQYFIPSRDSSFGDMLADIIGYLLAAAVFIRVYRRFRATG